MSDAKRAALAALDKSNESLARARQLIELDHCPTAAAYIADTAGDLHALSEALTELPLPVGRSVFSRYTPTGQVG